MNIYKQISANKWKTWFIMALFIVFITTLGYVFGKAYDSGLFFAGVALIISGITGIISYYSSDKMVLSLSGAHEIKESDNRELYHVVENLCIGAGLPKPKIYVIHDPSPNAFATGRDPKHAVVCFTTGLLERLSKVELEGVTAHELSHIKNFDIRLMAIVAILVGSIALFADLFMRSLWFRGNGRGKGQGVFLLIGILLAILSPVIATLIQLAISRKREFLADASGALLTRYPEGLASALEKIAAYPQPVKEATNATAHLFIENPFKNKQSHHLFTSLFNTHPPVEERIRVLRSM